MRRHWVAGVLLWAIFSGCASKRDFNRGELRQELGEKTVVTDQEIEKALALKPQLPRPFKVGVFFKDPDAAQWNKNKWSWSDEDKNKLLSFAAPLQASHEISEVILISPVTITGTDLKSLRLAAAQHGVDALLVVSGVTDVEHSVNEWGWTYIALVPALFVPASVTEVLFMSRAAMWDVRNQYLYLTSEAESLKRGTTTAFFTEERGLTEKAKTDSVSTLRDEIVKMMRTATAKKAE